MNGDGNLPLLGQPTPQVQAALAVLLKAAPAGGPIEVVTAADLVEMIRQVVREEIAAAFEEENA